MRGMSDKHERKRKTHERTPDGRKVFGLRAIGEQIGLNQTAVCELLASGELDVCFKIGKRWWAFVADLDRWHVEHSVSSAKRG